jgi:SAM-dependent methyltransferase
MPSHPPTSPPLPPDPLPFSAAAERNQDPILAELQRLLPERASVLEIASGTGQHARHFASRCPGWTWQPSDGDAELLAVIDSRCVDLPNVRPALRLDLLQGEWPLAAARETLTGLAAVYCANLLHISPWATCPALVAGAAQRLADGGLLLLYGPYRVDGVPTAPSNEAFDASLKSRNPAWGLRQLSAVQAEAARVGLQLQQVVAMPANNVLLVLAKRGESGLVS